jgi:pyruvate dehydrogenase E1 component
MNENYEMLAMPEGARDGILKGMYKLRAAEKPKKGAPRAQLLGSGAILNEVLAAQKILGEQYGVAADVWSVTSYIELYRDGHAAERWNMLHPGEPPRVPYVTQCLGDAEGVIVAASDYVKVLPDAIDRWTPRRITSLGTDGFGRSEGRASLRDFFEVDAKHIVLATLADLARDGKIDPGVPQKAIKDLGINPEKANPAIS